MRQNLTSLGLIVSLIAMCGFVSTIYAAPGDLDTSFSQDGKLVETIGTPISVSDWIAEVVIQPDGKIIALGGGYSNGNFCIIARYNTNGSLDSSFGNGGRIFLPFRYIPEIALQADGKIIVVGATDNTPSAPADMFIVRFNSDGSADTTFGGDGQVTTDFGGDELAYSVAVQPDGKIVAAGTGIAAAPADIVLARYNQDGSLDTTFDGDGKVRTDIANNEDGVTNLIVQPDGKIIVTGTTTVSLTNRDYMLVRYNPDGSLDTTFDNDGKVTTDMFGSHDFMASALLQTDGKIVVTGSAPIIGSPAPDFVLVRYNTNGSLDTTFDGDGKVTTDIPSVNLPSSARDMTIQSDGKIILTGSNGDFIVARYKTDGALDTTFDNDGYVITDFGSDIAEADTVIVQNDGKIIAAGSVYASALNQFDFGLVRYNPDSSLDTSFDGDGKVIMNVGATGAPSEALDVAVQPDGKIVFAGWSGSDTNLNFAVLRYLPNGLPDTSFNGNGQVLTDFLNGNDKAFAVAVQADGKIVAAGYASNATNAFVALARYNQDGSLDTSFGSGGKLTTSVLGIYDYAYDLIVQPDGKIVTVGYGYNGSNSDIALVRYNSNGSLDASFGSGGKTVVSVLSSHDEAYAVALQADGKIVATGSAYNGTSWIFTAVRVNANGSLDSTFDGDGRLTTNIPSTREGANSVIIQPDGKIVTVGIRDDNFTRAIALTRFNSNGSLDTTFDGDGQIITTGGVANSIALQTNGKIVVGGSSNSDFALYRYNTDGSLDTSYGIGGKSAFDVTGGATDTIYCLAFDSSGRAVVGGNSGEFFAVARVLGDSASAAITAFDFDGDGKADLSVFRPSAGSWYVSQSSNSAFVSTQFGAAGDLIAPADFDGDGKTDINVFRPGDGGWYRLNSSNNTFTAAQFGTDGDLPTPGDFDGDGRADLTVYRPSAGSWFRVNSSNNQFVAVQFGVAEDKPLVGDFDGDGKADLTVFRPSNGTWYHINSATNTFSPNQFGTLGDLPVAADYDGDGKTDLAVYRPSVGDWYILNSSNSSFTGLHFGVTEDKPAPADFDGDGRADLVVFRPSSGTWYLLRTTAGFTGFQFGTQGDIPTPNAFVR
jgi:uncharacterized delta-60 repeat protein